jgi:hypothetical protein
MGVQILKGEKQLCTVSDPFIDNDTLYILGPYITGVVSSEVQLEVWAEEHGG